MALEDESNSNTATTTHKAHSLNSSNCSNSPVSTRTSPYTCRTITYDNVRFITSESIIPKSESEQPYLQITSYALSSLYNYNKLLPKSETNDSSSTNTTVEEPAIHHLKYSIRNILQPDFGKKALQHIKLSSKIDSKPYDRTKFASKPISAKKLRQTVPEIGKIQSPEVVAPVQTKSSTTISTTSNEESNTSEEKLPTLWPAWVYCTRYSDRPSSGPRSRRTKKTIKPTEEKRPRTAFSSAQLARLKHEFSENRYLTEKRRQQLSQELGLNEAQIKIWFQNKRAKIKKSNGEKNPLALQLMAQGLYNHSTIPCDEDDTSLSP